MKNTESHTYQFLEDKPKIDGNLLFGHEEFGKNLVNMIDKIPNGGTLGLLGKWGTGKSTLAYFIKNSFKQKKVAVIIFDVWKHEKDALRRTFLVELKNQLLELEFLNEGYELHDRVFASKSTSKSESPYKVINHYLQKINPFLIGSILLPISLAIFNFVVWEPNVYNKNPNFLTLGTLIFLFFVSIVNPLFLFVKQLFIFSKTNSMTYGKFEDPHDFQEEFKNIIGDAKCERVIVVFDNIDRVSSSKAIQILSTIKTFLEPAIITGKNTAFIVPCDANAIREHVLAKFSMHNDNYNPNEFLKKLFSITISIPDFTPDSLESYTRKQLGNTKIPCFDDNNIAALIVTAFRDNPRQIIQFINKLIASYVARIKNLPTSEKELQSYIARLCRFLLLEDKFPELLSEVKKENVVRIDRLTSSFFSSNGKYSDKKINDFLSLVKDTDAYAPISDIRDFYHISDEDKIVPGIHAFINLVNDSKIQDAVKFINKIQDYKLKRYNFTLLITQQFISKITIPVLQAKFINNLLEVIRISRRKLDTIIYTSIYRIAHKLNAEDFINIKPRLLNSLILENEPYWKDKILKKWIDVLKDVSSDKGFSPSNEYLVELIELIGDSKELLSEVQEQNLTNYFKTNPFNNYEIASTLTRNNILQSYLSTDYLLQFSNKIGSTSEIKDIVQSFSILGKVRDDLLNGVIANSIIEQISNISEKIQRDNLEEFLGEINKLFRRKIDIFGEHVQEAKWVTFREILNRLRSGFNINEQRIFMPLFMTLMDLYPVNLKEEAKNYIQRFLRESNPEAIEYFASRVEKKSFLKHQDVLNAHSYLQELFASD